MREEIVEWIIYHSNAKPSFFFKWSSQRFKPRIKSKGSFPKILMEIYVRGLNNSMLKPSENIGLESAADSVTQKFLISDTTLRSFIPPQIRKMTPRLHHICGCEICINP